MVMVVFVVEHLIPLTSKMAEKSGQVQFTLKPFKLRFILFPVNLLNELSQSVNIPLIKILCNTV